MFAQTLSTQHTPPHAEHLPAPLGLLHSPPKRRVHFLFNDPAATEIYTLSLHDALPIYIEEATDEFASSAGLERWLTDRGLLDRKSTRLNSSHVKISYAVFCLKKKKKRVENITLSLTRYVQVVLI